MSSANLHHVTVKLFAEATGMSERQAKYWRKGCANPITRVMLEGGHVKPYQAARLVDEWDMGALALISLHVMEHGWALKDAELAILQVCSVERLQHPDIDVAELTRMINAKYVEPMRRRDAEGRVTGVTDQTLPATARAEGANLHHVADMLPDANGANLHSSADVLPDAITEIKRLRGILFDLGVDPDG